MIEKFLTENSAKMRLLRTIFQAVLAVLITKLPEIFGLFAIEPQLQAVLTPLIMAILSPVMAALGKVDTLPIDGPGTSL